MGQFCTVDLVELFIISHTLAMVSYNDVETRDPERKINLLIYIIIIYFNNQMTVRECYNFLENDDMQSSNNILFKNFSSSPLI